MVGKRATGFSLVELSVVLILIGIAVGGLLSIATLKTDADKFKATEEVLDKIEEALIAYTATYQRIPCPGDASLATNNMNFGRSQRGGTVSICAGTPPYWYNT
ncbi:MAG: type II secretion system protein, partial [Burkholderiales bacterium]